MFERYFASTAARLIVVLVFVLGVIAGPRSAGAQTRTNENIFVQHEGSAQPRTIVGTRFTLYQGYDENLLASPGSLVLTSDPMMVTKGPLTGIDGSIGVRRRAKRATVSLLGTVDARYYPSLESSVVDDYFGEIAVDTQIGRRTYANLDGAVSYRSSFEFGSVSRLGHLSLAERGAPGLPAGALVPLASLREGAGVSLRHQMSARSQLSADYRFDRVDYNRLLLKAQTAGTDFSTGLTEAFKLRLGYRFTEWDARPQLRLSQIHQLDMGVEYGAKVKRSTSLSASGGTVVIPHLDRSRHVTTTGQALIQQTFKRHWAASIEYARGVHFMEAIANPLLYNRVQTRLSGPITRAFEVSWQAAYVTGSIYLLPQESPYDLLEGRARVDYRMARQFRIFAEYMRYRYYFADNTLLPLNVARFRDRQAAQIGVTSTFRRPRS